MSTAGVSKRFHQKYAIRECGYQTPCWIWIAHIDKHGYGRIGHNGRCALAHRVSFLLKYGQLPKEIDHLCRIPACVNPDHLEEVNHRENMLRGISPAAIHAKQTECINGHPFDSANTYYLRGKRYCRACNLEAAKRYRSKP